MRHCGSEAEKPTKEVTLPVIFAVMGPGPSPSCRHLSAPSGDAGVEALAVESSTTWVIMVVRVDAVADEITWRVVGTTHGVVVPVVGSMMASRRGAPPTPAVGDRRISAASISTGVTTTLWSERHLAVVEHGELAPRRHLLIGLNRPGHAGRGADPEAQHLGVEGVCPLQVHDLHGPRG